VTDPKRDRDDPLMLRIDAALASWPERARSEAERDEAAAKIMEGVRAARGPLADNFGDADLFAPPLCATPGEVQLSPPVRTGARETGSNPAANAEAVEARMAVNVGRERDRRSLQDLARLASVPAPASVRPPSSQSLVGGALSSPPDSERTEDSGLIDLRAMTTEPPPPVSATASSAPPPASHAVPIVIPKAPVALASSPLFEDETAAPPSVVAAPVSLDPASQVAAQVAPGTSRKGNGVAVVLGGFVAAAALAAGGLLYMKTTAPSEPTATPTTTAAAPTAPVAILENAKPAATEAAKAEPAEAPAAPEAVVLGEQKLEAQKSEKPTEGQKLAANGKAKAPGAHEKSPAADKTAASRPDPKMVASDLPPSPAGPAGALGDAMKNAVKTGEPVPAAAETGNEPTFAPGTVAQTPSQGAVSGALGSVLPTARGCLGPDDPVSQARVTFKATGVVDSVVVTGSAAGKPAEACIRKALTAARVPPFAQDTFSANVKIRPN